MEVKQNFQRLLKVIEWRRYIQDKIIFPFAPDTELECIRSTVIQVDPYWEDIIDETNRRLNDGRTNNN